MTIHEIALANAKSRSGENSSVTPPVLAVPVNHRPIVKLRGRDPVQRPTAYADMTGLLRRANAPPPDLPFPIPLDSTSRPRPGADRQRKVWRTPQSPINAPPPPVTPPVPTCRRDGHYRGNCTGCERQLKHGAHQANQRLGTTRRPFCGRCCPACGGRKNA
jgi:hypothetical protein